MAQTRIKVGREGWERESWPALREAATGLVTEIMKTAESRAESLQSTDVKADSVMKRLSNALAKKNRLEKQAAGLEDGNNDN